MTDEGKLHKQRSNGQKASRLWEDPMIQGFFAAIDEEIVTAWQGSKGGEQDLREQQFLMWRLHQRYKQAFKSYMATGKLAEKQLFELEGARKDATGS